MENTSKYNLGLSSRFQLVDGKFELTGGQSKVDNNIAVLLSFINWFRIFKQDYVIDVYRFYQNSTNTLFKYKNILRLNIMDIGERHVPFAFIKSVDIPIDYSNRRSASIYINYNYNLIGESQSNTIKKVIL